MQEKHQRSDGGIELLNVYLQGQDTHVRKRTIHPCSVQLYSTYERFLTLAPAPSLPELGCICMPQCRLRSIAYVSKRCKSHLPCVAPFLRLTCTVCHGLHRSRCTRLMMSLSPSAIVRDLAYMRSWSRECTVTPLALFDPTGLLSDDPSSSCVRADCCADHQGFVPEV
jgi:hypothetical protein